MNAFLLHDIMALRTHLASGRQLFEPRRESGSNDLHWLPMVGKSTENPFSGRPELPLTSPKPFFFAERERLFRFDGSTFTETLPEPRPKVLFGVRSCDLCAIAYQDRFFRDDPYYQARRNTTLLVGLDCTTPCEGGFCPTVNAGPFVRNGEADLVCHPLDGRDDGEWLLISFSDRGEQALQGLDLRPATGEWTSRRKVREVEVAAEFPNATHITAGIQRINQRQVAAATWEAMGVQCLACSGCSSLCPTCSCYATLDQSSDESNDAFVRDRCWDSCLYEAFQREASNHNPSASAGQRVERFWFHKFSDSFAALFGRYGCTGCGRCEKTCPGVIGVHSVMKRVVAAP